MKKKKLLKAAAVARPSIAACTHHTSSEPSNRRRAVAFNIGARLADRIETRERRIWLLSVRSQQFEAASTFQRPETSDELIKQDKIQEARRHMDCLPAGLETGPYSHRGRSLVNPLWLTRIERCRSDNLLRGGPAHLVTTEQQQQQQRQKRRR